MSKLEAVKKTEQMQLKKNIPAFAVGDTVRVHTRIIEGDKERTQVFMGIVIARKGTGLSETFSVHRVAYGEGMERVFLLHSPRIVKIELMKKGHVRRGKLYYLRGATGKAAKVRGKLGAAPTEPKAEIDGTEVSSKLASSSVEKQEAASSS